MSEQSLKKAIPLSTEQMIWKPVINHSIANKWPTLIQGPAGCGKNYLFDLLSKENSRLLVRVNLNINVSQEDLFGQNILVKDGEATVLKFKEGPVLNAIQQGHWLLLDEVNAALPEVLFSLHAILERNHKEVYIPILQKTVEVHDNFRVLATMNPSEEYFGTRNLNQAFVNRFVCYKFNGLQVEEISNLLNVEPDKCSVINLWLNTLRNLLKRNNLNIQFSIRDYEKILNFREFCPTSESFLKTYLMQMYGEHIDLLPKEQIQELGVKQFKSEDLNVYEDFLKNRDKYDFVMRNYDKIQKVVSALDG